TGAVTTKKHCQAIPYTPVEIAEEARRAHEAGAAIVHIHARNDDGSPTWSKDTFARIMAEVKQRCPVLINWSTGGAGPMSERVSLEDNFYLPSGEMAKSNGELVAAAVELVRLSGRSAATVDETRQLLWPRGGSN